MKLYITKIAAGLVFGCLLSTSAFAVVIISTPIDYDTAGLVGTANIRSDANPTTVTGYANDILALGAGVTSDPYQTHNTDDYVGTLDVVDALRVETGDLTAIPVGFDYVMAKYDGQNAGWVLFYLGGEEATIPLTSDAIWTNGNNGYGISNWTGWRGSSKVPEPGTVGLLGAGLLALGFIRGRRRA